MNVINIIKGIEQLAVELLLWIIYVPKTIYKIIKDPDWVPGYIKGELEEKDKFKGYMSPILLFLAVSVLLYVLLDSELITADDEENTKAFWEQIQGPLGLLFLALPLYFALFVELFRKGGLRRENLLHNLYVQCYFFSPLMLAFFAILLSEQFDWELSEEFSLRSLPLYLMFILTLLWFIIIQVRYISRELQFKKWRSFGLHLLSYAFIGIGGIFYLGIDTEIVDKNGSGDQEKVTLKIPETGEYQVVDIRDFFLNPASNYTIALNSGKTSTFQAADSLRLIHNQVVQDSLKDSLLFTFKGQKGNRVELKGSIALLDSPGNLTFKITGPSSGTAHFSEKVELKKRNEENETQELTRGMVLKESGDYLLIVGNDKPSAARKVSLGFYNDNLSGSVDASTGKLINGSVYHGISFLGRPFNRWSFTGKRNEETTLFLTPNNRNLDIAFNVVNSDQESIIDIDRNAVANIIHWLYVLLFGYVIFVGYKALFRKSEEAAVVNVNAGSKAGRIASVIGIVIFIMLVLAFFLV